MSKKPEKLHEQDQLLFSEAVSGITPLEQDKIIPSSEKNRSFVPGNKQINEDSQPNEMLSQLSDEYDPFEHEQQRLDLNYYHHSIGKRQFLRIKSKPFSIELILDLHGYNRENAREELIRFIEHCQSNNYRQVAIMPGHGMGILRQSLNIWLRQLPSVLAFAESPQNKGGKGLIRVLLSSSA